MSDLTLQWLLVALDVSVKAILLAGIAALVLRFTRQRDSNVCHRVWMGVLVGMLVLPALSQIVPVLRLPFHIPDSWRIADADGDGAPLAAPPALADVAQPVTDEVAATTPGDFPQDRFADTDFDRTTASDFDAFALPESEFELDAGLAAVAPSAETAEPVETVGEETSGDEAVAASGVPTPPSAASPPRWPVVLLTIWLAGACVMGLRLLIGVIYSCRLVCCSTAITAEELTELGVDARSLSSDGRAVPIAECPRICVPLALGVFRPWILLPAQWLDWSAEKLRAVIAHERTHIQRADGAVIFLAELNRCLYWFHPLAWWLRSHLGQLAEIACDDAAIGSTGDRTTYARHLLEVAAAVSEGRSRLLPVGISMARPSHIESRINTILDLARPLSKRLTWATSLLLLAAMIPLIALAAAVRPATEAESQQQDDPVAAVDDEAADETSAAEVDEPSGSDAAQTDAQIAVAEQQSDSAESTAATAEYDQPAGDAEDPIFTYAGTVLDEEGQPVAGAKLSMNYWRKTFPSDDAPPLAVTDEEGKFEFQRRLSDFADAGVSGGSNPQTALIQARLIAQREGHGLTTGRAAWFETTGALQEEFDRWLKDQPGRMRRYLERLEEEPTTVLTLVPDDVPLRGRIVNTEGQPVAGAKIEAVNIYGGKDGSLDAWEEESARSDATFYTARRHLDQVTTNNWLSGPRSVEIPSLQTDAEGRFTLRGLGRERIAEIYISGPGIETRRVNVRTRPGEVIRLAKSDRPSQDLGSYVYYPSEFTYVAGPSVPVEGRVTDKQTGEPLAGLAIAATRIATSQIGGTIEARYIQATTDERGNYRLEGLPIGRNEFQLIAPAESGYLPAQFAVTLAAEESRYVQDIELTRGIIVRGQVTDSRTGKPVAGTVAYFAFSTNPHLQGARSFRRADVDYAYRTDERGRYEIPALPGPGVLAFRAEPGDSYPRGVGAEQIEGPSEPAGSVNLYRTVPSLLVPRNYNLVIPLDPEPGTAAFELDLVLTSGITVPGEAVSPDGEVLSDYYILGDGLPVNWSSGLNGGKVFDISGYLPTEPRRVMIYHPDTNLVGVQVLSGPPPEKVRITLQPGAILKGRALDQDGLPLENVQISNQSPWAKSTEYGLLLTRLGSRHITTDQQGRFEIPGIIPGLKYGAGAIGPMKYEDQTLPRHLGILFSDVTAEPGETKDLGEVLLKPREDKTATQTAPKDTTSSGGASSQAESENAAAQSQYSGHVRTPEGEPIAGANIWLAVAPWLREDSGSVHLLGTADAEGHFHVELDADTARAIRDVRPGVWTNLVATATGHGLDWLPPEVFADQPADGEKRDKLRGRIDAALGKGRFAGRTFILRPQGEPIRGRLIDLDGRPLPDVTVQVERLSQPDVELLMKAFEESSKDGYYAALRATHFGTGLGRSELQQLIPSVVTDDDGRFELAGIGRDQLVTLSLDAERVEARVIHVLGRDMEMVRLPHIDKYPGGSKDVFAGREFTYAVGPSVPVEGVVKDFDTGEPVANTLLRVERLFRREGSDEQVQLRLDTEHMRTVTDERGSFRITGIPPGEGHVLEARPPTSEPYLDTSHEISLSLEDGDAKEIEVQVKQGIWIEGIVTDLQSGQPLSGTVDYLALRKNPHTLDKLGLKQAWQIGRFHMDSEGRYRVPGLPGPGVVLVQAAGGYPREVGAESVDGYRADIGGGYIPTTPVGMPLSNWNFVKQIDPAADAASFTCDVQLDAGQSIPGRVFGPDGEPVADVKVLGEIANNAFWKPRYDGTFTVEGYDGEGPRQLFFKSPDETLVGQYRLEGVAPEEIVVTLQPAIRVTGRLIENETGLPAARYGLHCEKSSLFNEKYPRTRFRIEDCVTDDEGRFEIKGLIPGLVYEMNAANEQHFVNNRNRFQIDLTKTTPGEAIELGDVTGPEGGAAQQPAESEKSDSRASPKGRNSPPTDTSQDRTPKTDEPAKAEASASQPTEIRGRVVGADGKPVAGAELF